MSARRSVQPMDRNVDTVTSSIIWRMSAAARGKPTKRNQQSAIPSEHEGAIFDSLCTIRDLGQPRGLPIAHHVCDNLSKAWYRKRLTPQPFLDVAVKAVPDDYEALGFGLSSPSKTCSIPTYSPISHNQWTQVGTGQTPVGASHLRAILIQRLS